MKLNNWSIVRSPSGISAKPITQHNDIEVCVSIKKGKVRVGVHRDGYNTAIRVFEVAIKSPKPRKFKIKHAPGEVRALNQRVAEQEFLRGNEHMMWLYLFGAEFVEND